MSLTPTTSPHDDQRFRLMYGVLKARAIAARTSFLEAGIPEQVYLDTMSDLDVWAEDYFREHGHYGIREVAWIEKALNMQVFKLGRLQFEHLDPQAAAEWIRDAGCEPAGTLVLNTHIQAGAPLDGRACEESYAMAGPFYAARGVVFSRILFVCQSWLLNPLLHRLLPADCNILAFHKQYTLLSCDHTSHQMEERVFGGMRADPATYPEDTTLRRRLKAALMAGQPAGTGKGYFIRPYPANRNHDEEKHV